MDNNSQTAVAAALILLIVKALTTAGMDTKKAPLVALVLGIPVGALIVAKQYYPEIVNPILDVLNYGLGASLIASGAYSQITAGKVDAPEPSGVKSPHLLKRDEQISGT